jgi:ribosome assembly protein RRB1
MTAYIVAGTQADKPHNNKLVVMKLSQLHKTRVDDEGMTRCHDVF